MNYRVLFEKFGPFPKVSVIPGFINVNIGVLSSRLLSMEVVIKTFILLVEAFVGQVA